MYCFDFDIDLGLYVEVDVDLIVIVEVVSGWIGEDVEIVDCGGWGFWVDSGVWLIVDGVLVDFIFCDVICVEEQCVCVVCGEFVFYFQLGYLFGFFDVVYVGEVVIGVFFCDLDGIFVVLVCSVNLYFDVFCVVFVEDFWQVDFLLNVVMKGVKMGDVVYVVLCGIMMVMLIVYIWYVVVGQWVMNEKGLVLNVVWFLIDMVGFSVIVVVVFGSIGILLEQLLVLIVWLRGLLCLVIFLN